MRLWDTVSGQRKLTLEESGKTGIVSFSPDGSTLAGIRTSKRGERDERILLWDAVSGKLKDTLEPQGDFSNVMYSPDGITLAAVAVEQNSPEEKIQSEIWVWDAISGELMTTFELPESFHKWWIRYSPDGSMLAVIVGPVDEAEIWLWDVASGEVIGTLERANRLWSLLFSPDGSVLAGVYKPTGVILWDVANRVIKAVLPNVLDGERRSKIDFISFSPDGSTLAGIDRSGRIELWDVANDVQLKRVLQGKEVKGWTSVSYSPDGLSLASKEDTGIRVWHTASGRPIALYDGHLYDARVLVHSPDGKTLAARTSEGQVVLWDTDTGLQRAIFDRYSYSLSFSPDGSTLVCGGGPGVLLVDAVSGERKRLLKWEERRRTEFFSASFLPDGKTLVALNSDGTIVVWNAIDGQLEAVLEPEPDWRVGAFAISPDGSTLANAWNTVWIWDVTSGQHIRTFASGEIRSISFSSDGSTLAVALTVYDEPGSGKPSNGNGDDHGPVGTPEIQLWDVPSGKLKAASHSWADAVKFSPNDPTLLASIDDRGHILFWDADSGQLRTTLEPAEIYTFTFSPDGSTLIGVNFRGIWMWDVGSGQLMGNHWAPGQLFPRPTLVLGRPAISLSSDGSTLAIPGREGTVMLWDMSTPTITPIPTAVESAAPLPAQTALLPNYPNPFNASTQISYRLSVPGTVRLEIYNILGQPVRTLVDEVQPAGTHQVSWDGRDQRGAPVAAGVYLSRLQYTGGVQTQRLLYLK